MSSLIYRSPVAYQLTMRLLYGRYFSARYTAIAREIEPDGSVVDVCAGDGHLYTAYLRARQIAYEALDISPQLVRYMQQRGVRARCFDLWQDELPAADIIVMQASLYQFLPHADRIVAKLLAAAGRRVIITEPIRNVATSLNPVLRFIGQRLTKPVEGHGTYQAQRFNQASLLALFHSFAEFERSSELPGGREMLGIFRADPLNLRAYDPHSIQSRQF
jgi:hypothetical protein